MEEAIQFFSTHKTIFTILHVFSVIVGMGCGLASDVLFNSFISDSKINKTEDKTLSTLSGVIWVALSIVVLSGVALYLSDPAKYMNSTKFLVKTVIVGVVIINGYLFHRVIHPVLRKIDFKSRDLNNKYVQLRKLSFALGAVSVISWMSAFILGMVKSIPISFAEALGVYAVILVGGIVFSQIVEYRVVHKRRA